MYCVGDHMLRVTLITHALQSTVREAIIYPVSELWLLRNLQSSVPFCLFGQGQALTLLVELHFVVAANTRESYFVVVQKQVRRDLECKGCIAKALSNPCCSSFFPEVGERVYLKYIYEVCDRIGATIS